MKRRRWSWLYEWVNEGVMPRKHHAVAVTSPMRLQRLFVAWPLHYVVRLAFWFDYKWNVYRTRPTFIEREIRHEAALNIAAFHATDRIWTEEIVRGAVREVVGVIARRVIRDHIERGGELS